MKRIILIIFIFISTNSFSQYSKIISANNWNPDSLAMDNYLITHVDSILKVNPITGWCTWLHTYTYKYTDSSFSVIDMSQVRAHPMLRFFTLNEKNILNEDNVTTTWIYITVDTLKTRDLKPKTVKYGLEYSGWNSGPVPPKVYNIPNSQADSLKKEILNKRKEVYILINDGNDWIKKSNGKKLTKQEKNEVAWKIVRGKEKISNYTKQKQSIGKKEN